MIELDIDLPQGALLNGCAAELSAAITACGGTWLHGDDASLRLADDGETLIGWRSAPTRKGFFGSLFLLLGRR